MKTRIVHVHPKNVMFPVVSGKMNGTAHRDLAPDVPPLTAILREQEKAMSKIILYPDDPTALLIELRGGLFAIIDADDSDLVEPYRWYPVPRPRSWHVVSCVYKKGEPKWFYLHQLILPTDDGIEVDHWDCDGLNNRRSNLRAATPTQNMRNQKRRLDNSSGFKGVSWHASRYRWRAYINVDGSQRHLGLFADLIDAAGAYDSAARALFGDFARLNFPNEGEQGA